MNAMKYLKQTICSLSFGKNKKGNIMEKIEICAENMDQIDELLNQAQKRARTRRIDAEDVAVFAQRVANYKENHNLYWTNLEGCIFQFSTYENMPNSYEYKISFSLVEITVQKRKIYLTKIARLADYNHKATQYGDKCIYMTEYCKQAILNNMSFVR